MSNTTAPTLDTRAPRFRSQLHVTTHGAEDLMAQHQIDPQTLLARHFAGDHGEVSGSDLAANRASGYSGGIVLSCYRFGADHLWVITDDGHGTTTILLPDEY